MESIQRLLPPTDADNQEQQHELKGSFSIALKIFNEGWPFILNRVVEIGIDAASLAMLSTLSKEAESAASLILATRIILRSVSATSLYYTAPLVNGQFKRSQISGALDETFDAAIIGKILHSSWKLALPVSCFASMVAGLSKYIFIALDQPRKPSEIAHNFLLPYMVYLPFTLLSLSCQQLCLGVEKPKYTLAMTIMSHPIILGLGYILMHGKFGLHALDERGLGIAYAASSILHFMLYLILFKANSAFHPYQIFNNSHSNEITEQGANKNIFRVLAEHGKWISFYASIELGSVCFITFLIGSGLESKKNKIFNCTSAGPSMGVICSKYNIYDWPYIRGID